MGHKFRLPLCTGLYRALMTVLGLHSHVLHTGSHCTTFDNWRKAHRKVDGKEPFLPAFADGTKYGATLISWSQCLDLCSKSGGNSSGAGACKQVMFASAHNGRRGRGLLFE